MNLESFLELARSRRTIRHFRSDIIPDELIRKVIEAARWAPSAANSQPWEFIVIKNKTTIRRICEINIENRLKMLEKHKSLPYESERWLRKQFCEAPALIVVCVDSRMGRVVPAEHSQSMQDISIGACIENLMLAAKAAGLGSSWGTATKTKYLQDSIKEVLKIPDFIVAKEVVSIGYPAEAPQRSKRSLESMIHKELFNTGKLRTEKEINELLSSRKTPLIHL